MTPERDERAEDEEIRPGDPDYDLSEAHGYLWYPEREREGLLPPWLAIVVAALLVVALIAGPIIIIVRN